MAVQDVTKEIDPVTISTTDDANNQIFEAMALKKNQYQKKTKEVFIKIRKAEKKIYPNQTGAFPIPLSRGYRYIMVSTMQITIQSLQYVQNLKLFLN